ncbi:hypothetical protein PMIN01_10218 [Paraphaeosphaeria minitans]|uniref:Uncharacterized protein n=1 Tax=Paraphaeosphaeria minitans TaxID=565426 RepID=A0A9P6GDM4_9PLEO|nr:hypothetical protein PMIN01_10218 [Paraphaeosphaeria minitans]
MQKSSSIPHTSKPEALGRTRVALMRSCRRAPERRLLHLRREPHPALHMARRALKREEDLEVLQEENGVKVLKSGWFMEKMM